MAEILHIYSWHTLRHCLKMLTSWPQRSGGQHHNNSWPRLQITLSDLTSSCFFQSLGACQRHIKDLNSLKLAGCNTNIGMYDLYISDFYIGDLSSCHFHDHPIISRWWKIEVPLMRIIRSAQLTQNRNQIGYASEYGMDRVETIQSSPNPRAIDPNPVQSSWWTRICIQSSPIRTQQSRYLPNAL